MGELVNKDSINLAALALLEGKIVAFPTETVYGLGIIYDDFYSFVSLNRIKKRPDKQPYTLMIGDTSDIEKYALINEDAKKIIEAFMPGEITIILPAKEGLPEWNINEADKSVGIRVPDYPFVKKLIKLVGKPLLVPSANRHQMPPLLNGNDVYKEFANDVAYVVNGKSGGSTPSTIVRCYDKISIIREGNISKEQIEKVLGRKI